MKSKKQKVLNHLFNKLDTIKLEIYNIHKYRNDILNLYDFEKDSRLVEHKHRSIIRTEKIKTKKEELIVDTKKYLIEVKMIPLSKILTQAHKIVTYEECLYCHRESEINSYDFLKLSRKNALVTESRYDTEIYNNIQEINTLKRRLHEDLKEYFLFKKIYLCNEINLNPKNDVDTCLFLERVDTSIIKKDIISKDNIQFYKDKISLFKECRSTQSVFFKFIKNVHSSGLHQSFRKINEKIMFPNVRDMIKNVNNLTDYQGTNDLQFYRSENISKVHNENPEEESYDNFYLSETQVENNEVLDIKYPFYGGTN